MAGKRTWMSSVAGILDIICGAFALFGSGVLAIIGTIGGAILSQVAPTIPPAVVAVILSALAAPLAIMGILAIVGGIFALQRKGWGLALAGSIVAFFGSWFLGIAAIVFTALAKEEFE
ncbi:MAG: hypothetical protein FJZ85_02560 [Chloroflexi bacterium]|nr:hypothetical protein [Chloroflexota bacterium]